MKLTFQDKFGWSDLSPLIRDIYVLSYDEHYIFEELSDYIYKFANAKDPWYKEKMYLVKDGATTIGIVGFVLTKENEAEKWVASLHWMIVTKEFRGNGYGRAIMEEAEKVAKQVCPDLEYMYTMSDQHEFDPHTQQEVNLGENSPTVKFYKACGYELIGEIQYLDREQEDMILMPDYLLDSQQESLLMKKKI